MDKLLIIALAIVVIIFAPFIAVWSINTLFFSGPLVAYAIPYTFWTWLASLLFFGSFAFGKSSK